MLRLLLARAAAALLLLCSWQAHAQTDSLQVDSAAVEEDFSMYEQFDFADAGAKRFCTPKVFDLSPAKLIWLGYDVQGPFTLESDTFRVGNNSFAAGDSKMQSAGGVRVGANIPVISKSNIVWQMGFNYWRVNFVSSEAARNATPLSRELVSRGLTTGGLNTTIFKPLNDKKFIIAQASGDLNFMDEMIPLKYVRYSGAVLYGKKVNDRKMIGFGISRTYRVGELNYIPVMLLNWTHSSRKWGVEMMAPARANVRYNFSPRNLLFFGYELEGNSFRVFPQLETTNLPDDQKPYLELRRSELRLRMTWEVSLHKFIWLSWQAGYRMNWSFNVDQFPNDKEFFRGFFGDQKYVMENNLTGALYSMISLNLVSP